MATITITLVETVTRAARGRIRARMGRLLLVDPDLSGATIDYGRGDAIEVNCRDEILGAQIYRVVCDAIDGVSREG